MWVLLALCSATGLGVYDIMKKLSVRSNNVLIVLMLNTLFGMLLMLPVIIIAALHGTPAFGGSATGKGAFPAAYFHGFRNQYHIMPSFSLQFTCNL